MKKFATDSNGISGVGGFAVGRAAPPSGNDPRRPDSDGCRFMREMSAKERIAYVSRRARQQAKYHYRLAYPVFFPTCVRAAPASAGRGGAVAYNATRDGTMMRTIRHLMTRYGETGSP